MHWRGGFDPLSDDPSTWIPAAAETVAATMDQVAAQRRQSAETFSHLAARSVDDDERLSGIAAEFLRSAERAEIFAVAERSVGSRSHPGRGEHVGGF